MDNQQLCNPAITLKSEQADEEDNRNNNEDNEELEQQNQTANQWCSMPR